jgi:hypothetical protein
MLILMMADSQTLVTEFSKSGTQYIDGIHIHQSMWFGLLDVRFEVLARMKVHTVVFWVMTPCCNVVMGTSVSDEYKASILMVEMAAGSS